MRATNPDTLLSGKPLPTDLESAIAEIRRLERLLLDSFDYISESKAACGSDRMWSGRPLPEAIRELVKDAEGNPFFVVESEHSR